MTCIEWEEMGIEPHEDRTDGLHPDAAERDRAGRATEGDRADVSAGDGFLATDGLAAGQRGDYPTLVCRWPVAYQETRVEREGIRVTCYARWDKPHFKADEPSRVDRARAKETAEAAAWKAVCKAVDARDGKACRCCDKRSDPDATGLLKRGHRHHIVYRSAGGKDTSGNLCTLCSACHSDEHKNKLLIAGVGMGDPNADAALIFFRKDERGQWFIVREEISVRVVRKD